MPKMTGLELLKAVRKDENLKETPFIMITGENAEGNVVIAVREGVNNLESIQVYPCGKSLRRIGGKLPIN